MNDKECTQALERAIEKLEDIKEDVKAFIVLAVTDVESLNGTANTGVNAVKGKGDDLLNLLANLPNELILSTAMAKTYKALESFEKEEEDDKETFAIN
jgi:prophage DNA circulation protein